CAPTTSRPSIQIRRGTISWRTCGRECPPGRRRRPPRCTWGRSPSPPFSCRALSEIEREYRAMPHVLGDDFAKCIDRFAGAAPFGEDAKFDPVYQDLRAEVQKLTA